MVQGHFHNCSAQRKGLLTSTTSSFNTSNARLVGLEYRFTPEKAPDNQERKAGSLSFLAGSWESGKIKMFRSRCSHELDTSSLPSPTTHYLEVNLDGGHQRSPWSTWSANEKWEMREWVESEEEVFIPRSPTCRSLRVGASLHCRCFIELLSQTLDSLLLACQPRTP